MPDYTLATGDSGLMLIRDNGSNVELGLYDTSADKYTSVDNLPWAVTANGRTTWSTYNFQSGRSDWQIVSVFPVTTSQTVVFSIGDTNSTAFGGPTDFSRYLSRGGAGGGALIRVGNEIKKAIPYVNVNGVWHVAEPWNRSAGVWKQTT